MTLQKKKGLFLSLAHTAINMHACLPDSIRFWWEHSERKSVSILYVKNGWMD